MFRNRTKPPADRRVRLHLTPLDDRSLPSTSFLVTNLVSDQPGVAPITDPKLVNPWGISHSPGSPFWVSDNGASSSTLYQGDSPTRPAFAKNPLEVTIPSADPGGSLPTGQVFNDSGSATDFKVPSRPAVFIFASQTGEISGWVPGTGTQQQAQVAATLPGASFTGLAIGKVGTANYLYAADFGHHNIAVFDGQFHTATLAGSFSDPAMPHSYAPFNIQNLGGKLYVTYAQIDHKSPSDESDHGAGFVDVFDTSGNLLQRMISGNHLNAPWGIAMAPSSFGEFSNDLLVGNFGNGHIQAFDPATGEFLGVLKDATGKPIVIDGLWGIIVGNGGNGGNVNTLYFAAGPDGETHGLFGKITANTGGQGHTLAAAGDFAATTGTAAGAVTTDTTGPGPRSAVLSQQPVSDTTTTGTMLAIGSPGTVGLRTTPGAVPVAPDWDDPLGGPMVG